MLLEIEDEIERNSYTEAIARKYHIEQSMLVSQINREALKGVGRTEIRPPKSTDARRQKAAMAAAPADKEQKLMLTWIAGQPGLLERLKDYLSPADFTNPMYREVAEMVWEQGAMGKISPAAIINHFEDSAQQTEAASLFNTDITLDSPADRKKALFDVLCRMKRQSIDKRADELDPADMQGFMKIMDERKKLDQLRARGLPENIFS